MVSEDRRSYESAGVSLATANAVVERLRAAVESTGAGGFGHFAGLYPLDERRFLAASTDSVGSKLMLQRRAGRLRWGGMDLAAHCINDVLCSGATPLFFLDYVAAAHIELEHVADLVEGAAEVCRAAGCMLIGGETAELPGVYRDDELDFAGTCVGFVDRDDLIDGSRCARGDAIVGFPSSGPHTNGYTLIRAVVGDDAFHADMVLAPRKLYLVDAVASNRPDAPALERAQNLATATFELDDYADRSERDAAMADWLERQGVRIVVLAGYMHLLTSAFLDRFPDAVVNVHPSLLPEFPGARSVEEQLAAGVAESGATVPLVDEGVDTGPILAEERVAVL